MQKERVPNDVKMRQATMAERFITKGQRVYTMMHNPVCNEMQIEMVTTSISHENPLSRPATRLEVLKLKETDEKELQRLAKHHGATVKWRKCRSHDYGGRVYYENMYDGTTQWEKPESADDLSTDED